MTDDLWRAARTTLERVPAHQAPGLEAIAGRARVLRIRRFAVGALALVVVGVGVLVPLRLLSRLGEGPRGERIGAVAPTQAPRGCTETDPWTDCPLGESVPTGWLAHLDTNDQVAIQAPEGWVFRDDPTIEHEPKILFGLGSWSVPAYWEGEACGYDGFLSSLPGGGVVLWVEEIRSSASLAKHVRPVEAPPRIGDLLPRRSGCVPSQEVLGGEFRFGDRNFAASVAFGDKALDALRATADRVLDSFILRPEEEEYPPEPTGPVVDVGSGTAFGGTWTLSAYRAGDDICYRITGGDGAGEGMGCAVSISAGPEAGAYVVVMMANSAREGTAAAKTFAYGVVAKQVAGITLTLDDGRVLSGRTLASGKLPVAFYVLPFEGSYDQVVSIEALDESGNVLEERTLG